MLPSFFFFFLSFKEKAISIVTIIHLSIFSVLVLASGVRLRNHPEVGCTGIRVCSTALTQIVIKGQGSLW